MRTPTGSLVQVAFIGLGNMGGPMAGNLVKAGHAVRGYDPAEAASAAATERGVHMATSARAAAQGADVVFTMLPSGAHVLSTYDELLPVAAPGALFIDCSTIAVQDAREAARLARTAGHRPLDAPVSGGVGGAEAGTLTLMVGASEDDVAAAVPVLEAVSERVVHCGSSGAGQAVKICNNVILGISMAAVSEAFVLGERLGIDHQALFDVASTSSGQCWALTTNCPVPGPVPASPANRDYQPGFATSLMAKDLTLAVQAGEASGTDLRVAALVAGMYRDFAFGSGARKDFSALVQDVRDRSDILP